LNRSIKVDAHVQNLRNLLGVYRWGHRLVGAGRMRRRWVVLLSLVGGIAGYFLWVSRPEPSDRAEMTDTCSFPTISNAQYRALIVEAKKLIEPNRRRIANGDGNIEQGTFNPPLRDLTLEFVKRSRSTEETFVRLFAFGRALGGRVEDVAPVVETFAGPWGRWVDRDAADEKLASPRFLLRAAFQGPPGLFEYPLSTWLMAQLFGRRYERFSFGIWFDLPKQMSLDNALAGLHLVESAARKELLVWPLNSIRWGDVRVENRCPEVQRFLDHANSLFKQGKS
jgi:hypothetical protein